MHLTTANIPSQKFAYTNRVYVSLSSFTNICEKAVERGQAVADKDACVNIVVGDNFVFQACGHPDIKVGTIGLNGLQRSLGGFQLDQNVQISIFIPTEQVALEGIEFSVDLLTSKGASSSVPIDCDELSKGFKLNYVKQVMFEGQQIAMDFNGTKLKLTVNSFSFANFGGSSSGPAHQAKGLLLAVTNIDWKKATGTKNPIVLAGAAGPQRNDSLFKSDFDFEQMGIGGLGTQFQTIFRKAFASRIFPGLIKELGMNHVRGMLLYGPPGCGKTLIARQIGKVLNSREPKIVNGPEILDKFVGGSESKIRELFAEAEQEQAEMGDNSMLHIIIFDEMDAIMKKRGSTSDSTGVSDSVVNQLLSKIDGVDSLNNILIIGMTNRKDMIDEAILRPGRLEVQIEISLPNEEGRTQILNIHTATMKKNKRISEETLSRIPELSALTMNYTGAEIEGLVRNAGSFALARNIDAKNIKGLDIKSVVVEMNDFLKSIAETTPAFGNKDAADIMIYCRNGAASYGPSFDEVWNTFRRLMVQCKTARYSPLMSVLLRGQGGCGKTAIAAQMAMDSGFPFVHSYKSPLSMIFIDDIERLIEYSPVGPRFSNSVLQTLLILFRKLPPEEGTKLFIVATTSMSQYLQDLVHNFTDTFTLVLDVPLLTEAKEVATFLSTRTGLSEADNTEIAHCVTFPIGVKQLLLAVELASCPTEGDDGKETGEHIVSKEGLIEALHTVHF